MGKGYRSAALAVLIGLAFGSGPVLHAKPPVKLFVESGVAPGGDGSRHAPFGTVADAVAAGRTAWLADDDREITGSITPNAIHSSDRAQAMRPTSY